MLVVEGRPDDSGVFRDEKDAGWSLVSRAFCATCICVDPVDGRHHLCPHHYLKFVSPRCCFQTLQGRLDGFS